MAQVQTKPSIVITGSEGLIGRRLIHALKHEFFIFRLDVQEPESELSGTRWLECDLTDDESVKRTFEQIGVDGGPEIASVVHLAAYYDFSGEPSPMYDKLTVEGTRRVIRQAKELGIGQVIFSSSLLAMKPVESDDPSAKLDEQSPTRAEWAYPQSKLDAEAVLHREHGEVPVVILRIAGVYDDGCHCLPISQHIARIYEKRQESYFFPGDASHGQAYLHMDDLVACIRKSIERRRDLDDYEVFLVAESDVMSHAELQDHLGELIHGKEWPTIRIPKAAAKAGAWAKDKTSEGESFIKPWMIDLADDHYPVNISKARTKLGWIPQHRLRYALAGMIEALKRDPQSWYQEHKLPVPDEVSASS